MRRLETTAGWLSIAAGGLHLLVAPEHLEEWWAYGLFFLAASAFQLGYGLLLLTQGIEGWGGWPAVRRRVALIGLLATLAILALWTVSRTVGVPLGPEAFEPERAGAIDVAATALEVVLAGCLAFLLRRTSSGRAG